MTDTIKLLDAKTYKEMSKKARRDSAKLLERASRAVDTDTRRKLLDRCTALQMEALELEMRLLAAERGEVYHRIV